MIRLGISVVAMAIGATAWALDFDEEHMRHIPGFDPSQPQTQMMTEPPALLLRGLVPDRPLQVHYDRLVNMNTLLQNKLAETKAKLDRVLASEEFYRAVMDHQYNGQKTYAQNGGYTNQEIYDLIQLGKEKMSLEIDYMMNLELTSYYEDTNTIGYTYTGSTMIYVNRKFYNTFGAPQIARNLMHEWLHKVGFTHDVAATKRRPYSVPYGIGGLVERLMRRL